MTAKEATPRQEEILDRAFELVRESGLASLTMINARRGKSLLLPPSQALR